jgi:hypothetical protein
MNSCIFIKTFTETKKPKSIEESLLYFIKNSKIELLSDESAFGLVYKCTFQKKEYKSPYFNIDSNGIYRNVLQIVIKLVLLAEENNIYLGKNPIKLEWKYIKDNKLTTYYYQSISHFIEEVEFQKKINRKGIENLHRNTAILLFSNILEKDSIEYKKLSNILLKKLVKKNSLLQMFSEFHKITTIQPKEHLLQSNHFSLGIIAMEYIGSPYILCNNIVKPIIFDEIKSIPENKDIHKYDNKSLSNISNRLRWIYNIRRYELLRLVLDTGYSQGDYHSENIMIDEENKRGIILDFGSAIKFENIDYIKGLWEELEEDKFINEEENFITIREILEQIYNGDHKNVTQEFTEYNWIKTIDKVDINQVIQLHRLNNNKNYPAKIMLKYFL